MRTSPGSSGTGAEIVNAGTPDDVLSAVRQLGIVDTVDAANLRCATVDAQDSLTAITDSTAAGRPAAQPPMRVVPVALRSSIRSASAVCRRQTARGLKVLSDSGFVIFGLSTFRQPTTLFDANLGGPVDANYRLGPGDELVLILTGDVSQAYQLPVTRSGFIVIPQAGQIYVNNLTLGQLEDILYSRLGRVYSGASRIPGRNDTFFDQRGAPAEAIRSMLLRDVLQPGS